MINEINIKSDQKIIPKLNIYLGTKSLITDVGSTKINILNLIKKKLIKKLNWISSHPIAGSEVSGPEYGNKNLLLPGMHRTYTYFD